MLEGLNERPEKFCGLIKKAMKELSKEDQQILFEAIADGEQWTSNALAMALRTRGFHVHKNAVGEHRKRECACAK